MDNKRALFLLCKFIIVLVLTKHVQADVEFEGAGTLELEHAISSGDKSVFEHRATIAIRSIKNGLASYHSKPDTISNYFIDSLKEAAAQGGIYRIRVPATLSTVTPERYVYGWTTACNLLSSALSDEIHVHMNADEHIVSVSVLTPGGSGCQAGQSPVATDFNTTVYLTSTVQGPQPETNAYIEKIEKERIEREKGDTGDQRSFIGKYWMYIVPVVIFMVISNAAGGEGGGAAR